MDFLDKLATTDTSEWPKIRQERAEEIGREHGVNAASWVFDGNTTEATYRAVWNGIQEGDPAIMDGFRTPSLSGEFAGEYDQDDLARDLDLDGDGSMEAADELDSHADAYVTAASGAFWAAVEMAARKALEPNVVYWADPEAERVAEPKEIGDGKVMAVIASQEVDLGFVYVTKDEGEHHQVWFGWASDDPEATELTQIMRYTDQQFTGYDSAIELAAEAAVIPVPEESCRL